MFVQKRKKLLLTTCSDPELIWKKKLQLFLYTEFSAPLGNHPAQYSRKRNRNIKTTTATTTTTTTATGKQTKVYFLTKYNIVYIIHINSHQARIARKKLQKKTNKTHFLDAIFFPRFLSRHILIQLLNIFHNAEDVKTLGYIFYVCIYAFYMSTRFLFAPSLRP